MLDAGTKFNYKLVSCHLDSGFDESIIFVQKIMVPNTGSLARPEDHLTF